MTHKLMGHRVKCDGKECHIYKVLQMRLAQDTGSHPNFDTQNTE
jgi:hypothetical protein